MPSKRGTTTKTNGSQMINRQKKTAIEKINPIQRSNKNVKRSRDLRRQRDAFADKVAMEKAEQETELKDLRSKIDFYKRDNDKLIRQQCAKFGMTLDKVKFVKDDLEQARSTNDGLFQQVESRKQECEKLQKEMDNIIQKINEVMIESSDLKREKKLFEQERQHIKTNEAKIQHLVKMNKEFRSLLQQHKINPNTNASEINLHTLSETTGTPQVRNDSSLPIIYNRHNLLSFRSSEELRPSKKTTRNKRAHKSTEFFTAKEYIRKFGFQNPGIRTYDIYV